MSSWKENLFRKIMLSHCVPKLIAVIYPSIMEFENSNALLVQVKASTPFYREIQVVATENLSSSPEANPRES